MEHRYDHNCTCPMCSEYEQRITAQVQVDRDKETKQDVARREERRNQRGRHSDDEIR
jgi:hypothetical protein